MQVATTIETDTGEMIVKRVSVPIGLEELMEGLTKEVILKKPKDIYVFASEYFSHLLDLRRKGSFKGMAVKRAQSVTRQVAKEKFLNKSKSLEPPKQILSRQGSIRSESPLKKSDKIIPTKEKTKSFLDKRKARKASELAKTLKGPVSSEDSEKMERKPTAKRSVSSNRKDKSEEETKITPRQRSNSTTKPNSKASAQRNAQKPEDSSKKAQNEKKLIKGVQNSKTGVLESALKATPVIFASKKAAEAGPQRNTLNNIEESQNDIDKSVNQTAEVIEEAPKEEISQKLAAELNEHVKQKENDDTVDKNKAKETSKEESSEESLNLLAQNLNNVQDTDKKNINLDEEVFLTQDGNAAETSQKVFHEQNVVLNQEISKNEEPKVLATNSTKEDSKEATVDSDVAKELIEERGITKIEKEILNQSEESTKEMISQINNKPAKTEDKEEMDDNNVVKEIIHNSDTKETTSVEELDSDRNNKENRDEENKDAETNNGSKENGKELSGLEDLAHLVTDNGHTAGLDKAKDHDNIDTSVKDQFNAPHDGNDTAREIEDVAMEKLKKKRKTISEQDELTDKIPHSESDLLQGESESQKVKDNISEVEIVAEAKTMTENLSGNYGGDIEEAVEKDYVAKTDKKDVEELTDMLSSETTAQIHVGKKHEGTEGKSDQTESTINESEKNLNNSLNGETSILPGEISSKNTKNDSVDETISSDPKDDFEQIQHAQELKGDKICSGCTFTEDGAVDLMSSNTTQKESNVDLRNNKSESNAEDLKIKTFEGGVDETGGNKTANQAEKVDQKLSLDNNVDSIAEKKEVTDITRAHTKDVTVSELTSESSPIVTEGLVDIKDINANKEENDNTDKIILDMENDRKNEDNKATSAKDDTIVDVDTKKYSNNQLEPQISISKEKAEISKKVEDKINDSNREGKVDLDISKKSKSLEVEDTTLRNVGEEDLKKSLADITDQSIVVQAPVKINQLEILNDNKPEALKADSCLKALNAAEIEDAKDQNVPHQKIGEGDEDAEEKGSKQVDRNKDSIAHEKNKKNITNSGQPRSEEEYGNEELILKNDDQLSVNSELANKAEKKVKEVNVIENVAGKNPTNTEVDDSKFDSKTNIVNITNGKKEDSESTEKLVKSVAPTLSNVLANEGSVESTHAKTERRKSKESIKIKNTKSKSLSQDQLKPKISPRETKEKEETRAKRVKSVESARKATLARTKPKSKILSGNEKVSPKEKETNKTNNVPVSEKSARNKRSSSVDANNDQKVKEAIPQSSFDSTKLREELKHVEEELKANNFKSSFNPFVLRQEIKKASQKDEESQNRQTISTVVAALKIQALWRGFKVRKEQKRINEKKLKGSLYSEKPNKEPAEFVKESTEKNKEKNIVNTETRQDKLPSAANAVVKIQALWRGFKVRKDHKGHKLDLKPETNQNREVVKTSDCVENDENNKELKMVDAVLKIQAIWRGFNVRQLKKRGILFGKTIESEAKTPEALRSVEKATKAVSSAMKIQAVWRGYKVRRNIKEVNDKLAELQKPSECDEMPNQRGPTDEDIMRAATKIQAGVRGYMVRKKVNKNSLQPISEESPAVKLEDQHIVEAISKLDEVPNHSPKNGKVVSVSQPELVRQLAEALSMDSFKPEPEKLKNNSLDDGTGVGDEGVIINDKVLEPAIKDNWEQNVLDVIDETGEKTELGLGSENESISENNTLKSNEEDNANNLDAASNLNKLFYPSELSSASDSISNKSINKDEPPPDSSTNSEDSYGTAPTRPVTSDIIAPATHINNRNVASKTESYNENKQTEQSKNVGYNDEHPKNASGNKNNPVAATEKLLNEINNQITQIANEESKEEKEEKSRPTSLSSTASTDSVVTVIENEIEKVNKTEDFVENGGGNQLDREVKNETAADITDEQQIMKEEISKIKRSSAKFDLSKLRIELENAEKFALHKVSSEVDVIEDSDNRETVMGTDDALGTNRGNSVKVKDKDEENKEAHNKEENRDVVEEVAVKDSVYLESQDVQMKKKRVETDEEVKKMLSSDTNHEQVTEKQFDKTSSIKVEGFEEKTHLNAAKSDVEFAANQNKEQLDAAIEESKLEVTDTDADDCNKDPGLRNTEKKILVEDKATSEEGKQSTKSKSYNDNNSTFQETNKEKNENMKQKIPNKTSTEHQDTTLPILIHEEQEGSKLKIELAVRQNVAQLNEKTKLEKKINENESKMAELKESDLTDQEVKIADSNKKININESTSDLVSNQLPKLKDTKAIGTNNIVEMKPQDNESKTIARVEDSEMPIIKEDTKELKKEPRLTEGLFEIEKKSEKINLMRKNSELDVSKNKTDKKEEPNQVLKLEEIETAVIDEAPVIQSESNESPAIAKSTSITPIKENSKEDLQTIQKLEEKEKTSEKSNLVLNNQGIINTVEEKIGKEEDTKNIAKLQETETVGIDESIKNKATVKESKTTAAEIKEHLPNEADLNDNAVNNTSFITENSKKVLDGSLDKNSEKIAEEKLESEKRKFDMFNLRREIEETSETVTHDENILPKSNSPNNKVNELLLQAEIDQKVKPLESIDHIEAKAPNNDLQVSDPIEKLKLLSDVKNNKVDMKKLEQEINVHMSQKERNAAATKIQSTYRGYRVRRDAKYIPSLEVPPRELSDIKEEEAEGKFSLDSLDILADESNVPKNDPKDKRLQLDSKEDKKKDEEILAILLAADSKPEKLAVNKEISQNHDGVFASAKSEDAIVTSTSKESESHKIVEETKSTSVTKENNDVGLKTSSPIVLGGDQVNGQTMGTTTINLIHSGEFHDTITLPLPVSPPVRTPPRDEESEGLVNTGELHENVMPVSVQLNQAPPAGAEVLTSFELDSTDAGHQDLRPTAAQASDKDASTCAAQPDNVSPPSVSGMETEKRNNNAAAHSPKKNMEAEAATKIQAGFRGYQVRKQMKSKIGAPGDISNQRRSSRRKNSGRVSDSGRVSQTKPKTPELEEKSAVKIQAGIRGFLVRRRQKKQIKAKESAAA